MASDAETRAKEAFIDDHFELAVDLYSQAISMDPKNAELFADRSQANIKLRNFTGLPLSLSLSLEQIDTHADIFYPPQFDCWLKKD